MNWMSEDQARERHKARRSYVALIGGCDQPRYVVDVADKWVSVYFMDQQLRKYLSYSFKELEPGRLFLKGAQFWEFNEDSDSPCSSKLFNFDENGHIVIAELDSTTGEVREFESTTSVEENWEQYPTFGDYASLCEEERIAG